MWMNLTFELSEFFERGHFLLLNSLHTRREISISLLHLAMVIIAAGHFWQDSGSHQSKYWLISQSSTNSLGPKQECSIQHANEKV